MESPTPKIRLTQRRILLSKAHVVAEQHVIEALTPVFKQQFRKLERFLRRGNLRKRLGKLEKHQGPGNHESGSPQDVHGSEWAKRFGQLSSGYILGVVSKARPNLAEEDMEAQFWIAPDKTILQVDDHNESAKDILGIDRSDPKYQKSGQLAEIELIEKGFIRIKYRPKAFHAPSTTNIQTASGGQSQLRQLQDLVDVGLMTLHGEVYWEWNQSKETDDHDWIVTKPSVFMVSSGVRRARGSEKEDSDWVLKVDLVKGEPLGHPFRGNQYQQGETSSYEDPDTGEVHLGQKDEKGYITNAEPLRVYWGGAVPPRDLRDFQGGDTSSEGASDSGKNHYVTTSLEEAKGFAEISREITGKNARVYSFEIQPGEAWLPYQGAHRSDGFELAKPIPRKRIVAHSILASDGEWIEHLQKGEAEGHPFRGNQYEEGESDPDIEYSPAARRVMAKLKKAVGTDEFYDVFELLEDDEITPQLLDKKGVLESGKKARLIPMRENFCHGNASALVHQKKAVAIGTGFAFIKDRKEEGTGVWVQHSWGYDSEGRILETTIKRDMYFGIRLTGKVLADFVETNIADEYLKSKLALALSYPRKPFLKVSQDELQDLIKGDALPFPSADQVALLFQSQGSPTTNEEEWNAWKKALLIALLLGLFQATEDLAEVENLFWLSRGRDELTYDAETLILAYQLRTGRPLESIALATFVAIERLIREWYVSDDTFPQLLAQLNRYFNDVRIKTIARHEVGNLLSQMVAQQMVSYGLKNWYWDAMGENPCKNDIHIKGITYEGCSDLNGRHFILGDPMPPDAAHVGCQCLPTIREDLRVPLDRKTPVGNQHPKAPPAGLLKPPRTRRFLRKHHGPGLHLSGSPQSVHDPKYEGKGLLKEKAQLRHILKFRGKEGEKVTISKQGNYWVTQIVDAEGQPLSKLYYSYSKTQLLKSGNLAVQDIEAEIWKTKEPEKEVQKKGVKARLRAILKFEHQGVKISFERVGTKYEVGTPGNEKTFYSRMEAIEYAETLMVQIKGETPPSLSTSYELLTESHYQQWVNKQKLTHDELKALGSYGDGDYKEINDYFRFGGPAPWHSKDTSKGLDSAISKSQAPQNMIVWRGITEKDKNKKWANFWKTASPGMVYQDKGYTSTSSRKAAAQSFKSSTLPFLKIEVPKGSSVFPMGHYSGHSSEVEVLFPRGAKFEILAIHKEPYIITLRHIP